MSQEFRQGGAGECLSFHGFHFTWERVEGSAALDQELLGGCVLASNRAPDDDELHQMLGSIFR